MAKPEPVSPQLPRKQKSIWTVRQSHEGEPHHVLLVPYVFLYSLIRAQALGTFTGSPTKVSLKLFCISNIHEGLVCLTSIICLI